MEVDWLIGCDGAHSTIRKDLGLEFHGDTIPYDFALADIHVAGLEVAPDELVVFFHSDGMVLFIPIKGDRYRIIADLGPSTGGPRVDPTLEEIQAIVDRRVGGAVSNYATSSPTMFSGFPQLVTPWLNVSRKHSLAIHTVR